MVISPLTSSRTASGLGKWQRPVRRFLYLSIANEAPIAGFPAVHIEEHRADNNSDHILSLDLNSVRDVSHGLIILQSLEAFRPSEKRRAPRLGYLFLHLMGALAIRPSWEDSWS